MWARGCVPGLESAGCLLNGSHIRHEDIGRGRGREEVCSSHSCKDTNLIQRVSGF